jgi:DNA-binding transcriptional MerR regulator
MRTEGNYRLYTTEDVARLEFIRALRAAGIDLSRIAQIIARRLPMAEVLRARLSIIEHELYAQMRMAAAIRATLSLPQPSEDDFRKVITMLTVSNIEMKKKISEYVENIAEGSTINEENRQRLVGFHACELPDNPTVEQLEIWQRISTFIDDPDLRRASNISIRRLYPDRLDTAALHVQFRVVMLPMEEAWEAGVSPKSAQSQELVRRAINVEAEILQISEESVLENRIFEGECYRNGKSANELFRLCAKLRGEVPSTQSQMPPPKFWDWFQEALISLRYQVNSN